LGVTAAAVVAGSLLLAGCGVQSGQDLARQACVHVHRAVQDYTLSTRPGTAATTVAVLQQKFDNELRAALPLAASANSKDGSWNSLMTTISENATVDASHLIPSLKAQCVVADTDQNVNPTSSPGN
jgi:hypothetical protein